MDTSKTVSYRIRVLCKDKKITPHSLGFASGVPQSTIKSILNGESLNPGIVTVKKLCDGLGVSLYDFFNTPIFENLEREAQSAIPERKVVGLRG
jgi:transcriptional regulator with XRE-family HTH domain